MKQHKGTNKKPGFLNTANWLDCPCFLVLIGKGCSGSRELQKNDSIKKINLGWSVSRSSGPTLCSVWGYHRLLTNVNFWIHPRALTPPLPWAACSSVNFPPTPQYLSAFFFNELTFFPWLFASRKTPIPFHWLLFKLDLKAIKIPMMIIYEFKRNGVRYVIPISIFPCYHSYSHLYNTVVYHLHTCI